MRKRRLHVSLLVIGAAVFTAAPASAQFVDRTVLPNNANEGIAKSFQQQIGAGRGSLTTPNSSLFIINRDPFRSVRRGRQLFQRKFQRAQGQGPLEADGVGNINVNLALGAGLSDSCAGCHGRPRGSAGFGGDVVTRPDSRDAPHLFGLGLKEMLADEITADLRAIRAQAIAQARANGSNVTRSLQSFRGGSCPTAWGVNVFYAIGAQVSFGGRRYTCQQAHTSQSDWTPPTTPALWVDNGPCGGTGVTISYGNITARPDGSVITTGVVGVDPDLRVRPLFLHGGTISIREFVVGAFDDEMGMQSPDPDLKAADAGARIVTPSGMVLDGGTDNIEPARANDTFHDVDSDGVANEIPTSIVDHMEFYLLHYFKPGTGEQTAEAATGRSTFMQIGCGSCHIPDLTIFRDRRVADVETVFNPSAGNPFNRMFATATAMFNELNDGTGHPTLKRPKLQQFVVKNIFTDFKRHDLGPNFHEINFDGTLRKQFLTTALWGVGDTAPYGHDGRSMNLTDVILRHGGEAMSARNAFNNLSATNKRNVLEFLRTLVLFPPDDTASNLLPKNTTLANFPQFGHGAIQLSGLFVNPNDPE
jgi:hypothetical protein